MKVANTTYSRKDPHATARSSSTVGSGGGGCALAAALLLVLSSCRHEPPVAPEFVFTGGGIGGGGTENLDPCHPDTIYFTQILPLLVSNCAIPGCHDDATHEEGIRFTSFTNIMNSDVIDPGDAEDSDLIEMITETDPDDIMPPPPHEPLSQEEIDLIWTWIDQGASNNSCSGICDTTSITYSGTIAPLLAIKCTGCHSGSTPQAGLDFTSYAVMNMVALDGRLGGAIQHLDGSPAMPPSGGMLPTCEIDQILSWIQDGAPNN